MSPITEQIAAPEGSDISPKVEDFLLTHLDLSDFPLLNVAIAETSLAWNVKIEWLIERRTEPEVWTNYTQIVRTPFGGRNSHDRGLALASHLAAIEKTLWDGVPTRDLRTARATCGGVRHYLGRDPLIGDRVMFRPLRQTTLLLDRGKPGDPVLDEFLTEFSLQVIPAPRLCRRGVH